jgi:hypothetical protein
MDDMLIPRFTIRWLFLLMTVAGIFSLVVNLALQGKIWAIAIAVSVGSLGLTFLLYGVFFALAYLVVSVQGLFRRHPAAGSPFATAEPPPQWVPPQEPDTR